MTKNLIKTMLKATGNYYYFIGDDDKPNFNSLLKGVELIDQNTDLSDVIVFGAKDCLGYRQIFKNIKENTTTTIGVRAPILWASARLRYLNAKIKHPDSSKDNKLLRSCNLQL